jgi:hypothetical protein
MKESEYFKQQEEIARQAANNPAFEPWVREANRKHACACRRARWAAMDVEALEDRIAETEDRDEQLSLQAEIDEIRYNQEAAYENAR